MMDRELDLGFVALVALNVGMEGKAAQCASEETSEETSILRKEGRKLHTLIEEAHDGLSGSHCLRVRFAHETSTVHDGG